MSSTEGFNMLEIIVLTALLAWSIPRLVNNLSTACRDASTDGTVDRVDVGTGTAHLRIYTAGFATLLAELNFPDPAFGASSSGTAAANAIVSEAAAPASGTPAVGRVVDRDGATCWEFTAGTSGTDLIVDQATIAEDDVVSCSSFSYTTPAAAS